MNTYHRSMVWHSSMTSATTLAEIFAVQQAASNACAEKRLWVCAEKRLWV